MNSLQGDRFTTMSFEFLDLFLCRVSIDMDPSIAIPDCKPLISSDKFGRLNDRIWTMITMYTGDQQHDHCWESASQQDRVGREPSPGRRPMMEMITGGSSTQSSGSSTQLGFHLLRGLFFLYGVCFPFYRSLYTGKILYNSAI